MVFSGATNQEGKVAEVTQRIVGSSPALGIVFSVPWSVVDKSAPTFASVLACYQNGFFWKKVLERKN